MSRTKRRYVRSASDLPDHDLILSLPGIFTVQVCCHVRHYVHGDRHTVIVGQLDDGGLGLVGAAAEVARHVADTVVPERREFVLIDYTPRAPHSSDSAFQEVTFEADGRRVRPSSAVLDRVAIPLPCYRPLSLDDVERLAGRPVLTFPYRSYTRALAEAANGQPAARMLDLLMEMDLACPKHGPSRDGNYCSAWCGSHSDRLKRTRAWRPPRAPQRRGAQGAYVGVRGETWARIEFHTNADCRDVPVHGIAAPGVEWGYGGSGPEEGARTLLADYSGFLPRPDFRACFERDVVSALPRRGFALPVSELDAWYDIAHRPWARGVTVVAGPSLLDGHTGEAAGIAAPVASGLMRTGFDVNDPAANGYVPQWQHHDHRLLGMVHASLLCALKACSLIVVPYDGEALVQAPAAVTALDYAIKHDVPVVIAHRRAREPGLDRYASYGFLLAEVGAWPKDDMTAVVAAVDRSCAAYEWLSQSARNGQA